MHSLHYAVAQTRRAVERYLHKVTYLHKVAPLATIGIRRNGQSVKGWCGGWHAGQGRRGQLGNS